MKRIWTKRACTLLMAIGFSGVAAWGDVNKGALPETTTDKIPDTVVEFKLVKLPAGKVTINDKDGKPGEVEIKPIWIGQTEVTWDEYDVFWQALDLPIKQRAASKTDKDMIRSRPSVPYSPPDRGWGHDGSPAGSMFCREAKAYCQWLSEDRKRVV